MLNRISPVVERLKASLPDGTTFVCVVGQSRKDGSRRLAFTGRPTDLLIAYASAHKSRGTSAGRFRAILAHSFAVAVSGCAGKVWAAEAGTVDPDDPNILSAFRESAGLTKEQFEEMRKDVAYFLASRAANRCPNNFPPKN